MTKAAEMAKVSVKGGFHLMWGFVVSTVISAVGTIYLANLLSIENLRQMTSSLGPVNRILIPAINFVEKLLILINRSGAEPKTSLAT